MRYRTSKRKRVSFIAAIVAGSICLIISCLANLVYDQQHGELERERVTYVAENIMNKLELELSHCVYITDVFRADVITEDGQIRDFETLSAALYSNNSYIRSIQLSPNAIVTYVYPNDSVIIGYEINEDPTNTASVALMQETKQTVMMGPVDLVQGGTGLIIRNPIYLDGDDKQTFWGYASVILDVPDIFENVRLERLEEEGFSYVLEVDALTDGNLIQAQTSQTAIGDDPVIASSDVAQKTWYLSITPRGGWFINTFHITHFLAILSSCFAVAVIAAFFASMREGHTEHLRHDAETDTLTQLRNRRGIHYVLDSLLTIHERLGEPFCVAMGDIDHFKAVNDEYGHDAGDRALIQVADTIRAYMENKDWGFVGRFGGDEFLLGFRNAKLDTAKNHIETIRTAIAAQSIDTEKGLLRVTMTFGIAAYDADKTLHGTIIAADNALYEAKHKKKNSGSER